MLGGSQVVEQSSRGGRLPNSRAEHHNREEGRELVRTLPSFVEGRRLRSHPMPRMEV